MRNITIQLTNKKLKAGQKLVWNNGKNTSKTRWRQWANALECLKTACWVWHLISLFVVANRCRRNGFQHRWCEKFAKDVGGAQKGRRLALRGPMGCCALAHIILLLTRPEEVRAAQRALSSSSRRSLSSDRGSAVLSPVSLRRRSRLVL